MTNNPKMVFASQKGIQICKVLSLGPMKLKSESVSTSENQCTSEILTRLNFEVNNYHTIVE